MAAADPGNLEAMAIEQNRCVETLLAWQFIPQTCLAGDVSPGVFRPILPEKFRKDIFSHLHNISHPMRLASWRMVSSRFVWRGLANAITTSTAAVPAPSAVTATEVGPLTSPPAGRRQSTGEPHGDRFCLPPRVHAVHVGTPSQYPSTYPLYKRICNLE